MQDKGSAAPAERILERAISSTRAKSFLMGQMQALLACLEGRARIKSAVAFMRAVHRTMQDSVVQVHLGLMGNVLASKLMSRLRTEPVRLIAAPKPRAKTGHAVVQHLVHPCQMETLRSAVQGRLVQMAHAAAA